MNNNQIIKGEYFFDITIYTMFCSYNIRTANHNLITNEGISFFLNKWISIPFVQYNDISEEYKASDDYGHIGYIGVGTSEEPPKATDDKLKNLTYTFTDINTSVEGNSLIMTTESDGSHLDGTCEIGVYSTNMLLVSRDVHTRYTLPTTSSVRLTYKFTLNQIDQSEEDYIEEEYDD